MAIDAKHLLKLGQAQTLLQGFATKADARFRKTADAIAKTDLATALQNEIDAKAEASDLTTLDGKVTTLIGSDASKSVRTIANEELAAQLIPESAKEALDTLQEIAAWIQNHPDEAAAINAKLTLGTHEVGGEQVQYSTVKDYVEAVMSAAELSPGNGISISNNVVSAIVEAANGLSLGANGIALATVVASTNGAGGSNGAMTAAMAEKLDGIEAGAQVNTVTSVAGKTGAVTLDKSDVGLGNLTNDRQVVGKASGTTSGNVVKWGADGYTIEDTGFTLGKSVPADAVFTDTTYSEATTSAAGLMSASDKEKLDGFEFATDAEVTEVLNGIWA